MIAILDNYDSFTYNLVQLVGQINKDILVLRNDDPALDRLSYKDISHLIVSPGPGKPEDAGKSIEIIKEAKNHIPILGVCLGHQAIIEAFGGKIIKCSEIKHGKISQISYTESIIFKNLDDPFEATRYHSLCADPLSLPKSLRVTAKTETNTIMAVEHIFKPVYGVQFHPESIATVDGFKILNNFLEL